MTPARPSISFQGVFLDHRSGSDLFSPFVVEDSVFPRAVFNHHVANDIYSVPFLQVVEVLPSFHSFWQISASLPSVFFLTPARIWRAEVTPRLSTPLFWWLPLTAFGVIFVTLFVDLRALQISEPIDTFASSSFPVMSPIENYCLILF